MASIFSQTLFQPQVAMAVSHLAGLGSSGARAVSSLPHPKSPSSKTDKKAKHSATTAVIPETFTEVPSLGELSLALREACPHLTTPTTALVERVRRQGPGQSWVQSHTSAQSFFENKTGFPHHQLESPPPPALPSPSLLRRALLSYTHALRSVQYSQRRGFKTKRSQRISSMYKRDETFMDSIQDIFGKDDRSKSSPLGSQRLGSIYSQQPPPSPDPPSPDPSPASSSTGRSDPNIELVTKAFTEGYKAKEEASRKKNNLRTFFLIGLTLYILYTVSGVSIRGGEGGAFGFLNNTTYEVNPEDIHVTFDDVRGASEAKQELKDVVNFLRDPEKYTTLGAKLPKGVLLVGPPGVGKTLLARAVAGEAQVPFFHASGSEFDELFVGLGAKRIRQLFTAAKEQAPCIIFIDEFDSVGAKRTSSAIHPYANQTVNQLLSEMDGFAQNEGIIVMGATNKVDNMDKALRRPGRFDVEVTVSLPDLKGRKEIIELYISKIKKDPSVDVDRLAKGTTGFSGAELENLVNQAALKAVIDGRDTVTMQHLEHARDKIIMGPERKHRIPDEETNWITAYHEAGHTLVAYFTSDATPLHKVTIIPRGQSLGHTSFIDEKEVYNKTVSQLRAQMDVGMGGRAAEEVIFGPDKVTTGASSDLVMTTRVATAMVTSSGMSDKVGLRVFADSELSPAQRETIDSEIRRMLQESYERAKAILTKHNSELHALAKALMKYETLDKDEIRLVCEGKALGR